MRYLYLYSGISGGDGAWIDFDTEDALIRLVVRVAGLAAEAALHDHAELLALLLPHRDLHEAGRQRVMLHRQLDYLARLKLKKYFNVLEKIF